MQAICQWGARVLTELALGGREFRDLGIWECLIMEVKMKEEKSANLYSLISQSLNSLIPEFLVSSIWPQVIHTIFILFDLHSIGTNDLYQWPTQQKVQFFVLTIEFLCDQSTDGSILAE
jgi:hypothetical protein